MDSLRHNRIAALIREKVAADDGQSSPALDRFLSEQEQGRQQYAAAKARGQAVAASRPRYNDPPKPAPTRADMTHAVRSRVPTSAREFAQSGYPAAVSAPVSAPVRPFGSEAPSSATQGATAPEDVTTAQKAQMQSMPMPSLAEKLRARAQAPATAVAPSPAAPAQAPTVSPEMQAARDRLRERAFPNASKTDPGAGATPGIAAVTGKAPAQTSLPAAAPAAGGEKKQFTSYWQMAKAMNEGVTDPSKRVSAAELSKKFDGRMIQKGDSFDLNAIRGGTYAGASGAKGSFDKWQAARAQKAAPASSPMQLATPMAPARQTPNLGSAGQLTPPPATVADIGASPSRATGAPRITTPGGGTLPPGSTGVLGTPPPMRPAPAARSPSEQARTAAAVANARQQVRQGSTASSDTIANSALSATKPLVPRLQTQL